MTTPNLDHLRERIRERLTEDRRDEYCEECHAQLTEADYEAQACTNCEAPLPEVDQFGQQIRDEFDEDLEDLSYGDY